MREFTVDALVEIGDDDTLTDMLWAWARSAPDRLILAAPENDGVASWAGVPVGELAERVRRTAQGLIAAGVRAGDRVAILGPTCVDWVVADFAVLSVGAISVPIYPTASAEQIRAVVRDAAPVVCFAEPGASVPGVEPVWPLGEMPGDPDGLGAAELEARLAAVRADDVATVVYTSGTTGTPKGCVLTHRNILAAAGNVVALLPELFGTLRAETGGEQASTLLFLPLSHVYGRVVLFGCVQAGTRTGLVANAGDLVAHLPVFRPTFLVGVPYVLEKIRKAARRHFGGDFEGAERALIAQGAAIREGRPVGHDAEALGAWVRGVLGGRLEHMICGGASLDGATLDFFTGAGLTVLGAYGLTETTSTVSMSAPAHNRLGAAGRPVPGTTVAIADDGEILVRGPQVSPGYWPDHGRDPHDWVRTGDLGALDADGFLSITGRRKEILVTSGGKNVVPAPLEDRLRSHALVSNCMVVGEGRPFVTALITLDPAADRDDPALAEELGRAVDDANSLVSRAESIRAFRVLREDFTVANGCLTPSLRLRRMAIEKEFATEIDDMYAG